MKYETHRQYGIFQPKDRVHGPMALPLEIPRSRHSIRKYYEIHFGRFLLELYIYQIQVKRPIQIYAKECKQAISQSKTVSVEPTCTFLYHMKGQFIWFSDKKNGWWGCPVPFYLKFWVKLIPRLQKRHFSNDIRS